MIGYRRGYTIQELGALSLPSIETLQDTEMFPATSDGESRVFYFNKEGKSETLCDKLGRQENGRGLVSTVLEFGLDYAIFEDGTAIGKSRIDDIDLINGIITFKDPLITGDKVKSNKSIALDYIESTLSEEIVPATKAKTEVDLEYITKEGEDKDAVKAIVETTIEYVDYTEDAVQASGLLAAKYGTGVIRRRTITVKAEDSGEKGNGLNLNFPDGTFLFYSLNAYNSNSPDRKVLVYDEDGNGGTPNQLRNHIGSDLLLLERTSVTLAGGTDEEDITETITLKMEAENTGTIGNDINLDFNGDMTLAEGVSDWDSDYSSNKIERTSIRINNAWYGSSSTLTTIWNSKNIVVGTEIRFSGGADLEVAAENEVTDTVPVVFEADAYGPSGNNIELVFDEDNQRTIQQVIDNDAYGEVTVTTSDAVKAIMTWKTATVKLSEGAGESVIPERDVINSAIVGFEADAYGPQGDEITLSFDGVEEVPYVISNWNTMNPDNTVSITLLPNIFNPLEPGYTVPIPSVVELEDGSDTTGLSASVPFNGAKITCNYYKRAKQISSTPTVSLPIPYSVSAAPKRHVGSTFTNI